MDTPPLVRARTVGNNHNVFGRGPSSAIKVPVQTPFLVVAFKQHHMAALGELVNKIGFKIGQSSMHGVGFHNEREVTDGFQKIEETVVAVADAACIPIFVKAVFVFDMDGIRVQFFDFFSYRFPPVDPLHIDDRKHAASLAVKMTDNQNFPIRVGFLNKLARLFAKGGDSAQSGRIRTDHDDGLIGHGRQPPLNF
jgi:hypothetical protein